MKPVGAICSIDPGQKMAPSAGHCCGLTIDREVKCDE